jgi:hypothetical protein
VLQEDISSLRPLFNQAEQVLHLALASESGQSPEAVRYQQLLSRYSSVLANVTHLADKLAKASAKREDLQVSFPGSVETGVVYMNI